MSFVSDVAGRFHKILSDDAERHRKLARDHDFHFFKR